MSIKSLLKNLSLSLTAIAICVGLFEVFLRLVQPPLPDSSGRLIRVSSNINKKYELIPNAEAFYVGAPVTINSFGCRDREFPIAKSDSIVRIVGIGNSLTFGQGVTIEDTYLKKLERNLQKRFKGIEVINCGVFGYNVDEECGRFIEAVDAFNPDIILIGYELGDILPNPPPKAAITNERVENESATVRKAQSPIEYRDVIETIRGSRVATFFSYRFSFLLKKLALRDWDELYSDDSSLWKNLAYKYGEMATYARSKNIAVCVSIIPELSNLDDNYPFKEVHQRVGTLCKTLGFNAIDLLPAFRHENGPSLWVHPQDRHPNAHGHAVIASALDEPVSQMIEQKLAARRSIGARF